MLNLGLMKLIGGCFLTLKKLFCLQKCMSLKLTMFFSKNEITKICVTLIIGF